MGLPPLTDHKKSQQIDSVGALALLSSLLCCFLLALGYVEKKTRECAVQLAGIADIPWANRGGFGGDRFHFRELYEELRNLVLFVRLGEIGHSSILAQRWPEKKPLFTCTIIWPSVSTFSSPSAPIPRAFPTMRTRRVMVQSPP